MKNVRHNKSKEWVLTPTPDISRAEHMGKCFENFKIKHKQTHESKLITDRVERTTPS